MDNERSGEGPAPKARGCSGFLSVSISKFGYLVTQLPLDTINQVVPEDPLEFDAVAGSE